MRGWAVLLVASLPIGMGVALAALAAACAWDAFIAVLLVRRWKPARLAALQVATIAVYTLVATLLWPSLWLEPLAPIAKNVPILAAVLAWGAIEDDR
jgi:hypothetical protein